jgi:elongation factor Ts
VARNEKFQDLLSNITGAVLETQKSGLEITPDSIQSLKTSEFDVQNVMNDVILAIREKIEVGRAAKLQVGNGVVGCYVHNKLKAGVGDNAALVAIEAASYVSQNALEEFSRKLAMHVVAARPKFLSKQSVPKEVIEKEKQILLEQMKELQNKPPAILDKILSGKLGKFYEETCLLEQVYILDDVDGDSDKGKRTISDIVAEKSKELGTELHVSSFVRLRVAEANEI